MSSFLRKMPKGIPCIIVLALLFGYMGSVMGFPNMLNTIMNTAHDLLLNTAFYIMGMCVITGALSKILVEFGVVDLLQRLLRPVMKRLFNLPGVASVGSVMTFLSDSPVIISLAKDPSYARYFKKYQHVSVVNASFGMGLLVLVFMAGQGYYLAPALGLAGAILGRMTGTRLMQWWTVRDRPEFLTEDAVTQADIEAYEAERETQKKQQKKEESVFIRVLNAVLDGGKSGVTIGLAIIPGVVILSTFVMMMTFGGTVEGVDALGNDIVVYTGKAYQGTQLLPWLAGKLSIVFEWLFGFTAPELVAFPITALGTVGAALGLVPEFIAQGIMDGNAVAVFTAMGMCWSGYLSADAATLDTLGYRSLVARSFQCTFLGGITAGIVTHWVYAGVTALAALFAPQPVWEVTAEAWNDITNESIEVQLVAKEDGSYIVCDWYGVKGYDLEFVVNADSSLSIRNAYAEQNGEYFFVHINDKAQPGKSAYAALYPLHGYSTFEGSQQAGSMSVFAFIYDTDKNQLNRCYYELTWGGMERQTLEAETQLQAEIDAEKAAQDSIAAAEAALKAEKEGHVKVAEPK